MVVPIPAELGLLDSSADLERLQLIRNEDAPGGMRTPDRHPASIRQAPSSTTDYASSSSDPSDTSSEAEETHCSWSSCEMKELEKEEPLLKENPDRFSLFPIQ